MYSYFDNIGNSNNMTPENWAELRLQGIGGSDCASACGLSPWKSNTTLYIEKTKGSEAIASNIRFTIGKKLEPTAKEFFFEKTGMIVFEYPYVLRNTEYPFMLANLDGIIFDHNYLDEKEKDAYMMLEYTEKQAYADKLFFDCIYKSSKFPLTAFGVFESKATAIAPNDWVTASGEPPEHYQLQLNHYFAVTGLTWGYIATIFIGRASDFNVYEYKLNESIQGSIIKLESEFWDCVINKVPPLPDGTEDSIQRTKTIYEDAVKNSTIYLTDPDTLQYITEYLESCEAVKYEESRKNKSEAMLRHMLKDNEYGFYEGYTIACKKQKNGQRKLKIDY